MKFLDKIKVKTAKYPIKSFDLSCDHLSTAEFMEFNPVLNVEMAPNSKIKLNHQNFIRLAPMPVPTFGTASVHNRAFFVRYATVWKPFTSFITDTQFVGTLDKPYLPTLVPSVRNSDLISLITDSDYSTQIGASSTHYDFEYNGHFYLLCVEGKKIMKTLNSLGYRINFGAGNKDYSLSALPLLCLVRIYIDWYYPSAYSFSSQVFMDVLSILNRESHYYLDFDDLYKIFGLFNYVNYDSDYFVSAWDKPFAPNDQNLASSVSIDDQSGAPTTVDYNSGDGAPILNSGGTFSQHAVSALKALSDYLKRHQLSGGRALDRYLSRFGVTLSADKLDRSYYIGCKTFPLQFGDVTSQSGTSENVLGDYAGRGVGYDANGNFEFETKEFGMLFIINTIVPKVGYVQGIDRTLFHVTKLDFYTPEFDNIGMTAISSAELFVPNRSDGIGEDLFSTIFGFLPQYAEYKTSRDRLTGDFALHSMETEKLAWSLFRLFDENSWGSDDAVVHSPLFVQGRDYNQYNRIFYAFMGNQDYEDVPLGDHFNCIHRFGIKMTAPMKPLYDTYDFDGFGDTKTIDVNGVKMN